MKTRLLFCLVVLLSVFGLNKAKADQYVWSGLGTNSNWNNPANWYDYSNFNIFPGYPSANDDAYIGVSGFFGFVNYWTGSQSPTVNTAITCNSLTMSYNKSATLTLAANLTVSNNIDVGGTTTVTGAYTLKGATMSLTNSNTTTFNCGVNITGATTVPNGYTPTMSIGGGYTATLTGGLTVGSYSSSGITFSGSGTASISGTTTLNQISTLTNSAKIIFNSSATLTANNSTSITNSGTITSTNTTFTLQGNPTYVNNSGTFSASGGSISLTAGGTNSYIINSGTFNITSSCALSISNNSEYISNSGTFSANSSSVSLAGSGAYITNSSGGTFKALATSFSFGNGNTITNSSGGTFITQSGCTFTLSTSNSKISNAGTYTDHGSTYTLSGSSTQINNTNNFTAHGATFALSGNSSNITNSSTGSLTIDSVSTATLSAYGAQITNSGTAYYGTSNSACTLNLNNQPTGTTTGANLYNSGTGYLGSTSIVNFGSSAYQASIYNSGTFTLQSDQYGSASIGQLYTSNSQVITGNYNVQRYVDGGALSERNYRFMSNPVYQTTVSGINYYGFTDLQATTIITGYGAKGTYSSTQPTNAFDNSITGNPTIFFYYEPDADPNTRVIAKSDYKGINAISDKFPVGNGYLFFFRGNRNATSGGVSKLTTSAVPENTTLNFYGNINQGTISVSIPTNPLTTNSNTTAKVYATSNAQSALSTNFSYTSHSSSNDGLHLVGNPFPCAIDLEGITLTNPGTNSIYMVNDAGTVSAYTKGSNSTTLVNGVGRYVLEGQGFMVVAKTGNVTTLSIPESAKVTSVSASSTPTTFAIEKNKMLLASARPVKGETHFISAAEMRQTPLQEMLIKLSVDTNEATGNETCIRFANNATAKNSYDPMEDAYYQYGITQNIFMSSYTSDGKPCIINAMGAVDSVKSIQLYAEGGTSGLYKFTFKGGNTIDPRFKFYLVDNFMKDSLDLSANDIYRFNIDRSNPQTFGQNRFQLNSVRTHIEDLYNLRSFAGAKDNKSVQLNWKTQYEGNYITFVVQRSTDGGKTYTDLGSSQSDGAGAYGFADNSPLLTTTNLYRLKQITDENVVKYSNIVTIGYQPINALTDKIMLYPNPTVSVIKMDLKKDVKPTANVSVRIYNMNGSLMMSTSVSSGATISQDVSALEKGTYIMQVSGSDNTNYGTGKFTKL